VTLQGAREFTNRLHAVGDTGSELAQQWADDSVDGIRAEIPRVTGATAASIHAEEVTNTGARVVGSKAVTYLVGGTAAHEEVAHGKAMHWQTGGQNIFSKRVHHPATQGNSRILQAASDALHGFADAVYRRWNGAA
jgi:hypothetical protein